MKKFNVVFSRLYEVEAENELLARRKAVMDFDSDMELGFITSDNDDFSVKVSEV